MGDSSNDNVSDIDMEAKVNISESLQPKFKADLASICNVTLDEAQEMLERHNWNMQEAINAFLEKDSTGDGHLEVAEVLIDLDDTLKARLTSDLSSICDVTPAMAREMLENQKWNMQAAIDKFLNQSDGDDHSDSEQIEHLVQPFNLKDTPGSNKSSTVLASPVASASSSSVESPMGTSNWAPETFNICSWNLDGLDSKNLEKRTATVVDIIEKEQYSILFFQEMLPETFQYVATRLSSTYLPIIGTDDPSCGYLVATFLRLRHIIYEDHHIVKYPNTSMERNVLVTKAFSGRAKFYLLNTHLESTADYARERVNQLETCFKLSRSFPPEYNVIFGGDLNLRDKEVSDRIPSNMCDLWETCGSRETSRFTWDLKRNTNKQMPSKFQPSCRFDRLYFRHSDPQTIKPEFFGITGMEKVKGTQSFPSDHWAILSQFRLEQDARRPQPRKRKAENSTP